MAGPGSFWPSIRGLPKLLKITKYGEVTRFDLARTLLGRGRYWTTAYLVDDVLMDSGCAHCAQELIEALVTTPLRWIVNTHTHEDHIGANGLLQLQQSGLEIKAHPRALPILSDPRGAQPLHPYRRVMWGWPQPSVARSVADGEVIETEGALISFRIVTSAQLILPTVSLA